MSSRISSCGKSGASSATGGGLKGGCFAVRDGVRRRALLEQASGAQSGQRAGGQRRAALRAFAAVGRAVASLSYHSYTDLRSKSRRMLPEILTGAKGAKIRRRKVVRVFCGRDPLDKARDGNSAHSRPRRGAGDRWRGGLAVPAAGAFGHCGLPRGGCDHRAEHPAVCAGGGRGPRANAWRRLGWSSWFFPSA